jgi:diadenosine tetraphosphate (Ap4A) HIT family hydrolase
MLVIRDQYPVSLGHSLIIPKRHVTSWFELWEEELVPLNHAIAWARTDVNTEFKPDGYNLGVNDGGSAGQTVDHLHVHLIPRYEGDCHDPRGGVRWIFLGKARYWE